MSKGTCKLDGCDKPRVYRLYCHMHQKRFRETGDPGSSASSVMSTDGVCSVSECLRAIRSRGLCAIHYDRKIRGAVTGDDAPAVRRYATPEESFRARTVADGGCLVWTGHLNANGYGKIKTGGRDGFAHRYAWERVNGPIAKGMTIDHLCRNRACVNLEHLDVVTQAENNRRMALSPEEHMRLGEVRRAAA